jgi:hypothetical protein
MPAVWLAKWETPLEGFEAAVIQLLLAADLEGRVARELARKADRAVRYRFQVARRTVPLA